MTRDFRLLVFYMNYYPKESNYTTGTILIIFENLKTFFIEVDNQGQRHRKKMMTGVNETDDKFLVLLTLGSLHLVLDSKLLLVSPAIIFFHRFQAVTVHYRQRHRR
jgi:hypothetical protein